MKCDVVLAGVGGQGVLSIAAIIVAGAMREGLQVKHSDERGMSQRGGAVCAHLRLSDGPIHSDIIPRGGADLIIGLEPVESLRYVDWLKPTGTVLTSVEPVDNLPDYPEIDDVLAAIRRLPRARTIEAAGLARKCGSARSANMVVVGVAIDLLPIAPETVESYIRDRFSAKGQATVDGALRAFHAGREAVPCLAG